ncbi:hypothetical protein VTP01DRAFT_5525 [Rhizomucor pusillus]|uniref:uncharacterized protein n=1 Tax=Rhizomucor pusillus TaxID=4840 RepID=UPI003743C6A3
MSIQLLYENGKGTVVDEYGKPEPMDYVVDEEQYALETVSSYTQYLFNLSHDKDGESDAMQKEDSKNDTDVPMREASARRSYTLYTVQDKQSSWEFTFEAQRWAQQYKRDPDSIFKKQCIDENPSSVLEQLMERLHQTFRELTVPKSAVYDFVRTHCTLSLKKARFQPVDRNRATVSFLDESAFHVNMKRSMAWSKKGSPAIVTVPKTRVQPETATAASQEKKARRLFWAYEHRNDQYPHMKGHYLVMDNAPIHMPDNIAKYITSRGYRYAYLSSYSPELNPIEQFWSVVKSKINATVDKITSQATLTAEVYNMCPSCTSFFETIEQVGEHAKAHLPVPTNASKTDNSDENHEALENTAIDESDDENQVITIPTSQPVAEIAEDFRRTHEDAILYAYQQMNEKQNALAHPIVIVKTISESSIVGPTLPSKRTFYDMDSNEKFCFNCSHTNPGYLQTLLTVSPYAKLLQKRKYVELSNDLCDLLNNDWTFVPHMKSVTSSNLLDQLRQLTRKFNAPSSYYLCRASGPITKSHQCHPYSMFTLADFDCRRNPASQMFTNIAVNIFKYGD